MLPNDLQWVDLYLHPVDTVSQNNHSYLIFYDETKRYLHRLAASDLFSRWVHYSNNQD